METWRITPEERAKHDIQFHALKPVNGFIKGDQAKGFLMLSGLPGQVLGQIWGMADMNADGMMDQREFSIAMFLIQKKLRGTELPKVLPESLKADPSAGFTSPAFTSPVHGAMKARAQTFGSPAMDGSQTMMTSALPAGADWSIPPQNRARYQQTFQARDTGRRGHLTGTEARGVLLESGLPQQVLAQIWNLSDIDNDGRLSQDEFIVAMYLVESARAGQTVPTTLPPAMIPPSCRSPSLSQGAPQSAGSALQGIAPPPSSVMGGMMVSPPQPGQPADPLGSLMSGYRSNAISPPLGGALGAGESEMTQEEINAKTFEDRRKENFDKGQAELERRRALLREQQKAESEARLALERAEQDKREAQRMEQERKKQQDLEKQMQRQREVEQEKDEQRRKAMEQRESARRELERQRQVEWERQRMEQLMVEKNRIQEEVLQLKRHNSNTVNELETLENKKNELVGRIEQSTVSVKDITGSIERMRQSRDIKLVDIERLQGEVLEHESKQKRYDDEVAELTLQLETSMESNPVSDSYRAVMQGHGNKQLAVEKLTMELEQIQSDSKVKQADLENNNTELQSINNQISSVKTNIKKLLETRQANLQKQQQTKKLTSQSSLGQKADSQQSSWFDTFEDKSVFSNTSVSPAPRGTSADMFSGSVSSSTGQPVEDSWATFADDGQKGHAADKKISQGIWEDAFSSKETINTSVTAETETKTTGVSKWRVLYPFDARHQDELTINPGDIVMVNNDQSGVDQDWMGGEMNGKYGWFPEAYVEKVDESATEQTANGPDLFGHDKFTFGGATAAESSTDPVKSLAPAVREEVPNIANAASPIPGAGQPAPEGLQAQALHSWRAKKDNHLTFNKGDILTVNEQQEMWWLGTMEGRCGWFPKSYVKLISAPHRSESRSDTPLGQERKDSLSGSITGTPPAVETASKGESYVAMYTYSSQESGDLCFNQGDVITVTLSDGDWWTGIFGGKTGIFPGNYVQKVESQASAEVSTRRRSSAADSPLRSSNTSSPLRSPLPEPIIAAPPPASTEESASGQLTPDLHAEDSGSPARPGTPADGASQGLKLGAKKPEIASVIAAYHATGSEQLSLSPGQLIMIRKRSPSGWWEGELQARGQKKKIGWFPANYVKVLAAGSARTTPVQNDSQRSTPQPAMAEPTQAPPQIAAVTAPVTSATPPPLAAPVAAAVEQVVAIYPYEAQNIDELTFPRDAVINVINKDDPDWWKGEVNGKTGLFPSNYIKPLSESDYNVDIPRTAEEKKRQHYINELIETEETYVADMSVVLEIFSAPMAASTFVTEAELQSIFVNWNELVHCNSKLVRAFRVRKHLNGAGKPISMIGDILCEHLPHLTPYIRYCSCQLKAASLIQAKTENFPEFKELTKGCVRDPRAKGMPLSSFLLKPMQRITKYPLMISKVLEHTSEDHPDRNNLTEALANAEELCSQVNEGVREKEHSDQLEWIQTHVIVEGLPEKLTFNSVTNCLGPRKFLHCGTLHKLKNGKELVAFLFNDILLLTLPNKPLGNTNFQFTPESKMMLRMYKNPIFLNEIAVRSPSESESSDQHTFIISHIDRIYQLKAVTANERDGWMRKLDEASKNYLQIERKRRERACSLDDTSGVGRFLVTVVDGTHLISTDDNVQKIPVLGRLLVVILEGNGLVPCGTSNSGKSDPYCEVSMGSQEHKTKVINGTLNPKWNSSMQFTIKDLDQDVLCITVYDRDLFSPNDFMGRTEIRIADVRKDTREKRGPITKRLTLLEVESGEVTVKLDLQLYDEPQMVIE